MSRAIRYRKANKDRLIELLKRLGYKVTSQSTNGEYMLVRLPDGKTPTGYWIQSDRIEHKLDDFRGGTTFYFNDVFFELDMKSPTVSVVSKLNKGCFISFHNFDADLGATRE